jgi:5'-3' exonuclease
MFDERKYVEVYLAEDAKRELGVSRSEFVCLSYLLGSDYSEGVRGVGIVNAREILATFGPRKPEEDEEEEERTVDLELKGIEHANNIGRSENDGGEGAGGGFMTSSSSSSSSSSVGGAASSATKSGTDAAVLEDVKETLEQFKAWLFTGHDFVKTLQQLRGDGSTASHDVEPVSERVRSLVSGKCIYVLISLRLLHSYC